MLQKRAGIRASVIASAVFGIALIGTMLGCATSPGTAALSDEEIAADVRARLREDSVTGRYGWGVAVEDGVVTLYGAVPDEMVRRRAVGVAVSTPGVVRVVDEVRR